MPKRQAEAPLPDRGAREEIAAPHTNAKKAGPSDRPFFCGVATRSCALRRRKEAWSFIQNAESAPFGRDSHAPRRLRLLEPDLADEGAQQQNGAPPFINPGPYGYFGPCPNLAVAAFGAPPEIHDDEFILYAFKDAALTPPPYDPGSDPANPLNPVRQLANFFESHPSLLGKAELKFTSDATPATCPGFPNPPFACAP